MSYTLLLCKTSYKEQLLGRCHTLWCL